MARIAQRVRRLRQDRLARHQPKHDGVLGVNHLVLRYPGGVARKKRLTTARRKTQADVRKSWRETFRLHGNVGRHRTAIPRQRGLKCGLRPETARTIAQESSQRFEHSILVILESDHSSSGTKPIRRRGGAGGGESRGFSLVQIANSV